MQIKFYTIPIMGGEKQIEDMNVFLRSKKILDIDKQLMMNGQNAFWCFCISYIDDLALGDKEKVKVDYKQVLSEAEFSRFSKMREIRKQLSVDDGVPAYAIFIDEELAALAKIEDLTLAKMKKVEGIGVKKIEKYGQHFIDVIK